MKTKKLNTLKLKGLKDIGNGEYGLQKEITPQHTFRTANIRFEDYEEHLMKTTALLKVCILALDGQGDFGSISKVGSKLKNNFLCVLNSIDE
ncbi:hypothetical protein [Mesonia aestuariivivens]|uniref:Uncharacterized protein n=1 Tax=Mesonia aestuariivivens TaxID=2796128 RepID=A0ABS6W5B0_9FLAO|nr:hypothetical protein [Mesonia aestuariivivens]MBW2963052.1 hypothetical protein [Mesonia aestuariivivens]